MAIYKDTEQILRNLPDDLPYKASVKRVLIQAPAADVAEVRHGTWIKHNSYVECPFCGAMPYNNSNYCPKCGAKMDGKGEGE